MAPFAYIRRALIGLLGTAIGMGALVLVANADELRGAGAAAGAGPAIRIHDAATVQREFCSTDAEGRTWLALPGGARFELIADVDDPAIVNKGDGAFHAFEADEVRAALDQVRFPLADLDLDVYILPLPRRGGLESAAAPGMILLSPGVRPLSLEHQHAEVIHELGHAVQYALLPDLDRETWSRYRALRGIEDEQTYWSGAAHANRPHEIFAEDFRALFGSALANYSGTVENAAIAYPAHVAGLREFMLSLAGELTRTIAFSAYPNPSRGAMTFARSGDGASPLDLYDPQGRRVATVMPAGSALGVQWTWDGRDLAGRRVQPGVLFARPRDDARAAVRVTILP